MKTRQYSTVRYNEVTQKSIHNAYQRQEGLCDQMLYWRSRSVEIDIWASSTPRKWVINHGQPGTVTGNVDQRALNATTLEGALQALRAVHVAVPDHEVITVFIENGDKFVANHTATDLDNTINSIIGRANIFKPADLLLYYAAANNGVAAASLRAAVDPTLAPPGAVAQWPLLSELRNRFIFVINGANWGYYFYTYVNPGIQQSADAQAAAPPANPICFAMGEASNIVAVTAQNYFVFSNLQRGAEDVADVVYAHGCISRTYPGTLTGDGARAFTDGIKHKVHHIATNNVNYMQAFYANVSNLGGWPFKGIGFDVVPNNPLPAPVPNAPLALEDPGIMTEPGRIFGIIVSSDDINAKQDSFFYRYDDLTPAGGAARQDLDVDGCILVPGSHTNAFAKAGIMARRNLNVDSPYFAILRPSAKSTVGLATRAMRVQYRTASGTASLTVESHYARLLDLSEGTPIYFLLRISNGGRTYQAYTSVSPNRVMPRRLLAAPAVLDAQTWLPIASSITFSDPLPLLGLVASSHGDSNVKFLFKEFQSPLTFGTDAAVGQGVVGRCFERVNPPRQEIAAVACSDKNGPLPDLRSSLAFNYANEPAHTQMLTWVIEDSAASANITFNVNTIHQTLFNQAFTPVAPHDLVKNTQRKAFVSSVDGQDGHSFRLRSLASGNFDNVPSRSAPVFGKLLVAFRVAGSNTSNRASENFFLPNLATGYFFETASSKRDGAIYIRISQIAAPNDVEFNIFVDLSALKDRPAYINAYNHVIIAKSNIITDFTAVGNNELYISSSRGNNELPFYVEFFELTSINGMTDTAGQAVVPSVMMYNEQGTDVNGVMGKASGESVRFGLKPAEHAVQYYVEIQTMGADVAANIKFDVYEDVSWGRDPKMFGPVGDKQFVRFSRANKCYITNVTGATSDFLVHFRVITSDMLAPAPIRQQAIPPAQRRDVTSKSSRDIPLVTQVNVTGGPGAGADANGNDIFSGDVTYFKVSATDGWLDTGLDQSSHSNTYISGLPNYVWSIGRGYPKCGPGGMTDFTKYRTPVTALNQYAPMSSVLIRIGEGSDHVSAIQGPMDEMCTTSFGQPQPEGRIYLCINDDVEAGFQGDAWGTVVVGVWQYPMVKVGP